jgi:hypothetical protein
MRCLIPARYNSTISNAYGIPEPPGRVPSSSKFRGLNAFDWVLESVWEQDWISDAK